MEWSIKMFIHVTFDTECTVGVCFINFEVFISQWVPITDWQQLCQEGRSRFECFFKTRLRAPIKSNSVSCPIDIRVVFAEPICPQEYVMISSIGDEKIGNFDVSGAHFYLERRSMVNRSLSVDCSINVSWKDGVL